MGRDQRYVSSELTHFVGRSLKDQNGTHKLDDQYDLLVKVIREGWVTAPPHAKRKHDGLRGYWTNYGRCEDGNQPSMPFDSRTPIYTVDATRPPADNELINPHCVCFCDIPYSDTYIHIDKYSSFGLSFRKSFLVPLGASPVFYLASDSITKHAHRQAYDLADPTFTGTPDFSQIHYVQETKGVYAHYKQLDLVILFRALGIALGLAWENDPIKNTRDHKLAELFKFTEFMLPEVPNQLVIDAYDALQDKPLLKEYTWSLIEFIIQHVFGYIKFFDSSKDDSDLQNFLYGAGMANTR